MNSQGLRSKAKVLFIIDGVAERITSRMLSTNLTSRLDFACYVQVVANYVLAFDLAMQQDFDVIVLPREPIIDNFSKEDFVDMISSARDSYSVIIHTVDHESVSHVPGQTVRSNKTGGYLVEDLIAAITSAYNRKASCVVRDRKRSRQEGQTEVVTQDQAHPSHSKLARTLQSNTHHGSYSPSYSDPRYADEIAYWQYCQWQWQLYYQSQGQLPVDPGFSNPSQALSNASAASNRHHHSQDHRHPNPHLSHSHPFPSPHPVPLMHPLHPTHTHLHPPYPSQPSLTVRYPARNYRASSCSSVTTEESFTSSSDLVLTTTTTHSVLARADRSDTESGSSLACTTTESLGSAETATNGTISNNNYSGIDIDIFDFDEYMFSM